MEPQQDLLETLPPDWKWQVLFATPETLERRWRTWLAAAQQAEEQTLLTYWARRQRN